MLHQQFRLRSENFLKYLAFKCDTVYPERGCDYSQLLSRFDQSSLNSRRKHASVIFLYKLLNGGIDSPTLLSQVKLLVPRLSSRCEILFFCEKANTNVLLKSPVRVMCANYNAICFMCDNFNCTLQDLKSVLKHHL